MAEKYYTCKQCDAEFITSHKRAFCTEKCRWRHKTLQRNPNAILKRTKVECTCKGCGVKYMPKQANRDKYCSRQCAFANKAMSHYVRNGNEYDRPSAYTRVYFKACEQCGKGFVAKDIKKLRCSDRCYKSLNNNRSREYSKKKSIKLERVCKCCGVIFIPVYGDKKSIHCSEECKKRRLRSIGKAKRRALMNTSIVDSVDPILVFERDGWVCQICGIKTPRERRGSIKPNAPELDHRIPLSKGGSHTYNNVQCSCRKCNGKKGNRSEAGQIPLFEIINISAHKELYAYRGLKSSHFLL